MSTGGKKQTIGFTYSMDVHMGLCRGPVDQIAEVRVGDRTAVPLRLNDNPSADTIEINQPDLFGGQEREGGIVGQLRVWMGAANQIVAGDIKAKLGGLVSDWRGMVTCYYSGIVATNNPYPKPWSFRVRRALSGWDGPVWYPDKARIWMGDTNETKVMGMNGAHIIYECLTNREWGRGFPRTALNETAFISAANRLCNEGFGLCLKWGRTDALDEFVRSVVNHIGAALYVDRTTGLWTLRLIRDDYDPNALPIYTYDNGLLGVEEDESGALDTAFNEIIVNYRDPVRKQEASVRVQDSAAFASQGSVRSTTQNYPGLPTAALALRIAQRDLAAQTQQLRRFKLRFDRTAWNIPPADVIRIGVPTRGITSLVLRVAKTEENVETGEITIDAVQDVFALAAASYAAVVDGAWTPPPATIPPATVKLYEANWQDLSATLAPADLALIESDDSIILGYAASPVATALNHMFQVRDASGAWIDAQTAPFAAYGKSPFYISASATEITLNPPPLAAEISVGETARITHPDIANAEEIVGVVSYDATTGELTVLRGCADTPPLEWPEGAEIHVYGDAIASDGVEYASGETVTARAVAKGNSASASPDATPTAAVTTANRLGRPYAPGNVRINGSPFWTPPAPAPGMWPLVLTWAGRNRLTQANILVGHVESGTAPEVGTTYTVRYYNHVTGALIRTTSGISAETVSYNEFSVTGDDPALFLRIEIVAVRDGVESFRPVSFVVVTNYGTEGFDTAFNAEFDGG